MRTKVFFSSAFLRYDLQIIKFTHLKGTVNGCRQVNWVVGLSPKSSLRTFLSPQDPSSPYTDKPHADPQPQVTTTLLSDCFPRLESYRPLESWPSVPSSFHLAERSHVLWRVWTLCPLNSLHPKLPSPWSPVLAHLFESPALDFQRQGRRVLYPSQYDTQHNFQFNYD